MSDPIEIAEGREVRILFEGRRCIHARRCVLTLPEVFRANVEGPWIHPDAAEADEIRALARRCPSGAIRVEAADGTPTERPPKKNVVAVIENGPLAFRGDLRIDGEEPCIRATLCRCGQSRRKPFCDNSHVAGGFRATGEPDPLPDVGELTSGGPLEVTPAPNGPLLVSGPVEVIRGGTGKTVRKGDKLAFCRCGQSSNKPFCDGTHRKVGFTTDPV